MAPTQDDHLTATLARLEIGDGCPIFVAAASLSPDAWGRRRVVSGRGLTPLDAERRCIAEAGERHASIYDPSAALLRATAAELGEDAVPPSTLLLISEQQFKHVDAWNRSVDADHRLPKETPATRPIEWVAGRSLVTSKTTYLPAAYCFLGYPTALAEGFPVPDSSGLASGDDQDSAIERSILEVIERDAVSIWWYGRVRRPPMQLAHDRIPCWEAFAAWIKACGRKFWILDLTHDLAVPVAAAISCNADGTDVSFGFAAARTREEAALAAMGELVQFELTKRLQAQQGANPQGGFLAWCRSARLAQHEFLRPHDTVAPHRVRLMTGWADCVEVLQEHGLASHLVALPTSDPSVHVTRAIVPGLRHLWPRFAPGRLYDVAFSLGWHGTKMSEEEINPVAILY